MTTPTNKTTFFSPLINKIPQFFLFAFYALVLLSSCAKEMAPTGGPKDIEPPKVRQSRPPFNTTNFDARKISITFNEFLDLKEASQKVIISPPLDKKPEIKLKGKTVVVILDDTLRKNTTYNINFYDVIRDFTEGNIAKNFQYVFSTGQNIDTIFITGKVVQASTGLPAANIQVGIYENIYDSVVSKEKPLYYAVTDKEGIFTIHNIKKTEYKIFALADIANDMLYKMPNEAIAFEKETFIPETYSDVGYDTLKIIKEINLTNGDTIYADSIIEKTIILSNLGNFRLNLFIPDYHKQFVKATKRPRRNLVNVVLNRDQYTVSNLRTMDSIPFIPIASQRADSLLFLVPEIMLAQNDTLKTIFEYTALDSLENLTPIFDTITFTIEKNKLFEEDSLVTVKTNIVSGTLERKQPLILTFNHPVDSIRYPLIKFVSLEDTIRTPQPFSLKLDSTKTMGVFEYNFTSDYKYELIVDSLAISDIFGQYSLPQTFKFRIPEESEYGVLAININGDIEPETIIELIDKSKKTVWQRVYPDSKTISAKTLKPGAYTLRLYVDSNRNKKWDTGNYYKGIQPEFVVPYGKDITIRANWDTEITWNLEHNH
jgi:5-hydroxyisourate hydrolase-like protein (transthyretin family)